MLPRKDAYWIKCDVILIGKTFKTVIKEIELFCMYRFSGSNPGFDSGTTSLMATSQQS